MKDIKDLEGFCMEEWSKIPPNVFSISSNILEMGSVSLSSQGEVSKTGSLSLTNGISIK
jgi:hypothetical protein